MVSVEHDSKPSFLPNAHTSELLPTVCQVADNRVSHEGAATAED